MLFPKPILICELCQAKAKSERTRKQATETKENVNWFVTRIKLVKEVFKASCRIIIKSRLRGQASSHVFSEHRTIDNWHYQRIKRVTN